MRSSDGNLKTICLLEKRKRWSNSTLQESSTPPGLAGVPFFSRLARRAFHPHTHSPTNNWSEVDKTPTMPFLLMTCVFFLQEMIHIQRVDGIKVDYKFSSTAKCVNPAKCQRIFCQRISSWLQMSGEEETSTRARGGNKRRKLVHMCLYDSHFAEHLSSLCCVMMEDLVWTVSGFVTCFLWNKFHFELLISSPSTDQQHSFGIKQFIPQSKRWQDIKHIFTKYISGQETISSTIFKMCFVKP